MCFLSVGDSRFRTLKQSAGASPRQVLAALPPRPMEATLAVCAYAVDGRASGRLRPVALGDVNPAAGALRSGQAPIEREQRGIERLGERHVEGVWS